MSPNYKIVPFQPNISRENTTDDVASQVQEIVDIHLEEGWDYVRMESFKTDVVPQSGCFGIGAEAGYTTSIQMLVFKK